MKINLIKMILRRYRKILISPIVISALAIAMINGLMNAYYSLDLSLSDYLQKYGIADAVISTEVSDTGTADAIRQVGGVSRVIARLTGSSQVITSSGAQLTAQIISMDKDDILQLYPWEETEVSSQYYVLCDKWFAQHNGIAVGDVLRVRTGEDEYREFTVAAIISAPETMERTKIDLGVKHYPDFGFLYMPISLLETETEKETARMIAEWKEKQAELLQAEKGLQDAWEEGQAELSGAREELEKQEQAFGEKRDELKKQVQQLTQGRLQLTLARKELEDAAKTAEERKPQLEQTLERMSEQLLELEDRQAELTEVRNDLSSLLVQLEDAKGRLGAARDQLSGKASQLRTALRLMRSARTLWQQARSGGENLPSEIGMTLAELEAKLTADGITPENLDGWIGQAENGVDQLEAGQAKIQNGIVRINREYLPEIQSYLEQTEQGLETVAQVHSTLQRGIAEAEAGLKAISDFEQEAPDNREELNARLQQVEEGLQAIYSGLEEGETALSEGREQLEEKSAEAEETHADAESQLAEGAAELQKAWEELSAWAGYTPMRNEFLVWFDEDVTDPRQVLKDIEAALEVNVQNSELYTDSSVAQVINDNLVPMYSMALLVPPMFISIMMLVLFLFLSIIIRQSRRIIGILRALGFEKKHIRQAFGITCVLLMLLGAGPGAALSVLITSVFNHYFNVYFTLPTYYMVFNGTVYVLSVIAFILLALAAVWTTSRALSRIPPAEAVSHTVSAGPKVGRLSRFLLRRADPLTKFCLLSLKRNPYRFFSSIVCIACAVAICFATLSFMVSKNELLEDVFGRQIAYDAQVVFADEPDESLGDVLRGMESVAAAEPYCTRQEDLSRGEVTLHGSVMFLDPDSTMIFLTDARGNPLPLPEEGIMLSASYAEALGVQAGDTILVGDTEVVVSGISFQKGMVCQFLPLSEKEKFHQPDMTGWLVRLKEGADGREITDRLYREQGYVTTLWMALLQKGYSDLFASFDLYVWILILLNGIVSVFIVVTTGQNNLREQQLSLSILRVSGFQRRKISARWFLQFLVFMLFGLVIGFPLGRLVATVGLKLLSNSTRQLTYISSPYQYIVTTVFTFLFLLLGHVISVRIMKKWDLVENTKGRE